MFKNLFPVRCKTYFNYVTGTFFPVGLCTSSQKWHGAEETRKTSQHHFTCPALLCSTESDFSDLVAWNWKSENRNVITHVELFKAFIFDCPFVAWMWGLKWVTSALISSFRPIPCLFTWWGNWHPHSSCRDWGWRGSETQITPEPWVISKLISVTSCCVENQFRKANAIYVVQYIHVNPSKYKALEY